jgi:hypothetical protein
MGAKVIDLSLLKQTGTGYNLCLFVATPAAGLLPG